MPIYTYKCQDCGADLEKRQGFNDAPLAVCDRCGGRLRRTLHAPAIVFKGSGFYNTDYKNASTAPADGAAKTDGKDGAKSDGAGEKSEAAPAKEAAPAASGASGSANSAASTTAAAKDTAKAV